MNCWLSMIRPAALMSAYWLSQSRLSFSEMDTDGMPAVFTYHLGYDDGVSYEVALL